MSRYCNLFLTNWTLKQPLGLSKSWYGKLTDRIGIQCVGFWGTTTREPGESRERPNKFCSHTCHMSHMMSSLGIKTVIPEVRGDHLTTLVFPTDRNWFFFVISANGRQIQIIPRCDSYPSIIRVPGLNEFVQLNRCTGNVADDHECKAVKWETVWVPNPYNSSQCYKMISHIKCQPKCKCQTSNTGACNCKSKKYHFV